MKRDKLIKEIIEKDSFIFEDPCPLSHQELEEIGLYYREYIFYVR